MSELFLSFILFSALSGKIQGVVKDLETGEPILFADIIVLDTDMGGATDETGSFFILNVPQGIYSVEVSCLGYQSSIVKQVKVEIGETARLTVKLKQSAIEMDPIVVTSTTPPVLKDMTQTTYIMRKEEIMSLPIDDAMKIVSMQAAVANLDTALHVRGGRATEVAYLIDNVSIIDPQTGDQAIMIPKEIINEVIFLPGGFDAEYGRVMSGVINMITENPAPRLKSSSNLKTERIMPSYCDYGYEQANVLLHMPITQRVKTMVSGYTMHTIDWDPKIKPLPHKQRYDYSFYGKVNFAPSGKLRLSLSNIISRVMFDRYYNYSFGGYTWIFNIDHYRSDMRKSNMQALEINYLPDSRKFLFLTLSRLYSDRTFGVRTDYDGGVFSDFEFRDYTTLQWPRANQRSNPFGIYHRSCISEGDYPEYQSKQSCVMKANSGFNFQVHKNNELKAGLEYTYNDLTNFGYFVSNNYKLTDEYNYRPREISFYLQDNFDFEGIFAKIGGRYDYWANGVAGVEPTVVFSPRLGFSFLVTEKFLFHANVGHYVQPPLYDYMYSYRTLLPLPSWLKFYRPIIGNPALNPEKTTAFEIGFQGEVRPGVIMHLNTYYKDVDGLCGTRFVTALPLSYYSYYNVEFSNIRGIEAIIERASAVAALKCSYTLSWARGTSSYAQEVYSVYFSEDTSDTNIIPPPVEYNLDFDQRHRIFVQASFNLPAQVNLFFLGYFGTGFPYTPPGYEGKYEERNIRLLPFQKSVDFIITKTINIVRLKLRAKFEIINLLDVRYQIANHTHLYTPRPQEFFTQTYSIYDIPYLYSPGIDLNHDGIATPVEQYSADIQLSNATDDWSNAYLAPRRARLGITVDF